MENYTKNHKRYFKPKPKLKRREKPIAQHCGTVMPIINFRTQEKALSWIKRHVTACNADASLKAHQKNLISFKSFFALYVDAVEIKCKKNPTENNKKNKHKD